MLEAAIMNHQHEQEDVAKAEVPNLEELSSESLNNRLAKNQNLKKKYNIR